MKSTPLARRTVLSIISLDPKKIGGVEAYAKELSRQLGEQRWRSVLCFLSLPPPEVAEYFNLPNVVVEAIGTTNGWRYYLRLLSLLLRYRPAILHLHLVSLFGFYAWLACVCGVKKIFFTDHASRPVGFVATPRPIWKRWIFRGIMAPLTRIFCISHYVCNSFLALGLFPASRTAVIYNGVDLARIDAGMGRSADFKAGRGLSPGTFLVLQVGQIIPEKGVPDLLEAAARVKKINPAVHFLLVGDGAYLHEYRSKTIQLGLSDTVTFTGPLADPLATGVFAAADLVCQVSRWEEGFGLVIAEAMAAGRPILATRVGGIPELVSDGVTGYTVERGDVEALTARIVKLAQKRDLCAVFGAAGEKVCREKFDHTKNVAQLLNFYGLT